MRARPCNILKMLKPAVKDRHKEQLGEGTVSRQARQRCIPGCNMYMGQPAIYSPASILVHAHLPVDGERVSSCLLCRGKA